MTKAIFLASFRADLGRKESKVLFPTEIVLTPLTTWPFDYRSLLSGPGTERYCAAGYALKIVTDVGGTFIAKTICIHHTTLEMMCTNTL